MNTGQMLLVTGALALLGTTVLTVNRSHIHYGAILRQTEIGIAAVSVASSRIELAAAKLFDEILTTSGATTVNDLSSVLGVDAGEIAHVDSTFDDFDDFNGSIARDSVVGVDVFRTFANVYYVTTANPNIRSTARTFFKKIDVFTTGSMRFDPNVGFAGGDTIKLSYICSYFRP